MEMEWDGLIEISMGTNIIKLEKHRHPHTNMGNQLFKKFTQCGTRQWPVVLWRVFFTSQCVCHHDLLVVWTSTWMDKLGKKLEGSVAICNRIAWDCICCQSLCCQASCLREIETCLTVRTVNKLRNSMLYSQVLLILTRWLLCYFF